MEDMEALTISRTEFIAFFLQFSIANNYPHTTTSIQTACHFPTGRSKQSTYAIRMLKVLTISVPFSKAIHANPGFQISLALFSTWTRSWPKGGVGKASLKQEPGHYWVVALVKTANSKGKRLIIWDCDASSLRNVRTEPGYGLLAVQSIEDGRGRKGKRRLILKCMGMVDRRRRAGKISLRSILVNGCKSRHCVLTCHLKRDDDQRVRFCIKLFPQG